MLSRHSSFVPRRRYCVFGFLMLLSWCLFTLPYLWYAHHGARALSDSPRQRQIKHDSVITSYGTTNFSSPAISEAQHLPRHDRPAVTAESAKQYVKETRGNSDTLSVDHDNSRTDNIPIKLNNNNEFDSERTNRNDDVRIQNSGNDALAIENHGFASDENISSEGRGHDVVANSRQDVPTNSRNVILVTGNSGLDFVSGDKNRKDFPNNTHTGYSESNSLDHVNNGEEANQKTYENDLVNNENNMGESVPNSKNEHVSNRIIESGDARDGNNGNEFADDGKNGDSFVKNENKDDDFVNHDVHGDTAFIERENNRNIAHYKEKPAPGDTQINGTERFPWKPFKAEGVDCSKLFAGDESELQLAKDIQPPAYNTTDLIRDASGCSDFVAQNGFITSQLTTMERDFPIAYSILVYKDPAQVVDLLRAIYRPQNYYCLHVDSHTRRVDQDAFRAIAKCFHNVFLSSRSARVMWGQFGVLQAEVFCMEDLYQYPDWRYFINLTGQEFPLKTNYEIVKILKALRGANDVRACAEYPFMERWCRYLPAPHNLTIYKGSVHIAVSRPFVHYVLTSPVANDFIHWIRPIKIPDEVFFNTLNHNPDLGVPGSYNGPYVWRNFTHKPHLSRFKNGDHTKQWRCAGRKYVRNICILSAGDLPLLDARPELFANKFFYAYSHVARQCLTEKLYNRTRQETLGTLSFDVTYYENLPFLRHIVRGPEP